MSLTIPGSGPRRVFSVRAPIRVMKFWMDIWWWWWRFWWSKATRLLESSRSRLDLRPRQRQNGKKTNTVENTQIQSKIHKYKDKIQNCLKTIFFRCAMKFQHFRICICSYFPLIVIIVVNFCSHIVKFDFGLGNNIEFAPSFVLFRKIMLFFWDKFFNKMGQKVGDVNISKVKHFF